MSEPIKTLSASVPPTAMDTPNRHDVYTFHINDMDQISRFMSYRHVWDL